MLVSIYVFQSELHFAKKNNHFYVSCYPINVYFSLAVICVILIKNKVQAFVYLTVKYNFIINYAWLFFPLRTAA